MRSLSGKFHIGRRATWVLLGAVVTGGVTSSFAPEGWETLQQAARLVMMFCAGMLASQHAAIWEPQEAATSSPPTGKAQG